MKIQNYNNSGTKNNFSKKFSAHLPGQNGDLGLYFRPVGLISPKSAKKPRKIKKMSQKIEINLSELCLAILVKGLLKVFIRGRMSKWGETLTGYFVPGRGGWPGSGVSVLSCRVVVLSSARARGLGPGGSGQGARARGLGPEIQKIGKNRQKSKMSRMIQNEPK